MLTSHSEHARRSVALYQSLYDTNDPTQEDPTHVQRQSQRTLLRQAQKVLKQAEQDAADYPDEVDDEELQAEIEEAVEAHEKAIEEADLQADADMSDDEDEQDGGQVEQGASQSEQGSQQQPAVVVDGAPVTTDEQSFPSLPTPPRSRGTDA